MDMRRGAPQPPLFDDEMMITKFRPVGASYGDISSAPSERQSAAGGLALDRKMMEKCFRVLMTH